MSVLGVWAPSPEQARRAVSGMRARAAQICDEQLVSADEGRLLCARLSRAPALFDSDWVYAEDARGITVCGEARIDEGAERGTRGSDRGLLVAYERWAAELGRHVLGDFALCIWDAPKRRLHLLRDAMGVKPLYYAVTRGGLAWSTDFDLLRGHGGVSSELDPRMVIDYLGEFPEDDERTLLRDVRRLRAGHVLSASRPETTSVRPYYSFADVRESALDDAQAEEALRSALCAATASRLRGAARYGVLLSGGLDSSMVAGLAAQRLSSNGAQPLVSASAVFPDASAKEQRYQLAVARHISSEHVEYRPADEDEVADPSALLPALAQPRWVGPHWLVWPGLERLRERGVGVVLSGIDGDRVVSHGVALLRERARAGDLFALLRECWGYDQRSSAGRIRLFALQACLGRVPLEWLRELDFQRAWRAGEVRTARQFLRPNALRDSGLRTRVRDRVGRQDTVRAEHLGGLLRGDRTADTELLAAAGTSLGLSFVHPFLDRRVVELCLSLPAAQKRRGNQARYVLRNAMRGVLPEPVRLRRDKASFDVPFRRWLVDALRSHTKVNFDFRPLSEYVDTRELDRALRRVHTKVPAAALGPRLDFLWRSVILCKWLAD